MFLITDFIISSTAAFLAFVIAVQAFHAYRRTEGDYLLNFFVGFTLLGISSIVLIPLSLGIYVPTCCGATTNIEDYPLRLVTQSFAFVLIGLAYAQNRKEKELFYIVSSLLAVVVVGVMLPQITIPILLNTLLRILNTGVLVYILYRMLRFIMRSELGHPIDLVFVGFLLITLSQYSWIVYNFDSGTFSYFAAKLLQLIGLGSLFVAFLVSERPKPLMNTLGEIATEEKKQV